MKILITGGAGFIGSHLCDALMERGHNLTVVDNLILGRKENISHLLGKVGFEFIEEDLLQTDMKGSATRSSYFLTRRMNE